MVQILKFKEFSKRNTKIYFKNINSNVNFEAIRLILPIQEHNLFSNK